MDMKKIGLFTLIGAATVTLGTIGIGVKNYINNSSNDYNDFKNANSVHTQRLRSTLYQNEVIDMLQSGYKIRNEKNNLWDGIKNTITPTYCRREADTSYEYCYLQSSNAWMEAIFQKI